MRAIFLSYRREDSAGYAGRLRESLERRLGAKQVFRDVDGIAPGQDFVAAIDSRLGECRSFLAVIGREWLTATDTAGRRRLEQADDYVRLEIAAALARPGVLVVPVLVEGMAMPRAEDLPEAIRGLSRRQAVSLRDETWDGDVDRLIAALPGDERPAGAGRLKWAALAAAVLLAALVWWTFSGGGSRPAGPGQPADAPAAATTTPPADAAPAVPTPARAIAVPRIAEAVTGNLIYTLLSGSVASRGTVTILSLRVRISNDGRFDANFWDDTFRLQAGADVLAPVSGLNEIAPGHALKQGVIRFEIPDRVNRAVLRIRLLENTAEVPLDLQPTADPGETDRPDTRDALSHAIAAAIIRDPRPLLTGPDIGYTIVRASGRRFANAIRLTFTVRVSNKGAYPFFFTSGAFRLTVDGDSLAPVDGPNQGVEGRTDASADLVFDTPTTAKEVVLRATVEQDKTVDVPIEIPAVLR